MDHTLFRFQNLEQILNHVGGPLKLLRNSAMIPNPFTSVPSEYTNWRDEQRSWKESCALINMTYHMDQRYISGPDALRLFQFVAANKISSFPVNRGKQLITAGFDGYTVGDGICFHTADDMYRIAGPPMFCDWVQFHAESGMFDVKIDIDLPISIRGGEPRIYIYQIQGPHATKLMSDVSDGTFKDTGFFHITEFKIMGKPVRALRHGMASAAGFELFGPWEDRQLISDALERAGEKYLLRKVGSSAIAAVAVESAWVPLSCPAIYHSEEMKPYREWMTPMHIEVLGSLGGSLISDSIVDYYVDPVELGYGSLIDFEREFIGRDALAEKAKNQKRKKVTLVWNEDDVTAVIHDSLFPSDKRPKYLKMPWANDAFFHYDEVIRNGSRAGVSQYAGYSANAKAMLSLALLNVEFSEPGTEVILRWGEPNATRPSVEKNEIYEIRATVAPAPYFERTIKKQIVS